jgi:hypothetical protein
MSDKSLIGSYRRPPLWYTKLVLHESCGGGQAAIRGGHVFAIDVTVPIRFSHNYGKLNLFDGSSVGRLNSIEVTYR